MGWAVEVMEVICYKPTCYVRTCDHEFNPYSSREIAQRVAKGHREWHQVKWEADNRKWAEGHRTMNKIVAEGSKICTCVQVTIGEEPTIHLPCSLHALPLKQSPGAKDDDNPLVG